MGNFAIMRVEKVKTMSSLAARGRHNFREQDTPNADGERSGLNVIEGAGSTDELLQAVSDLLPSKRRKDAVIGLEYLITASPEHFGDWMKNQNHGQDYFADAIRWLEEKHGAENVVCKTIHLDESTPHLAAFVVPLKDGKLNAKAFTGGAKVLASMQTSFAVEVGEKHGLERGVERSKAVHQDNAKIQPMTIERMKLRKQVQTLEAEVERLTKRVGGDGEALAAANAENEKLKKELAVAVERKEYFAEMAKRYESHKAQGGDVFDFEPNREPPRFVKEALLPGTFAEKFARAKEEKRQREQPQEVAASSLQLQEKLDEKMEDFDVSNEEIAETRRAIMAAHRRELAEQPALAGQTPDELAKLAEIRNDFMMRKNGAANRAAFVAVFDKAVSNPAKRAEFLNAGKDKTVEVKPRERGGFSL